MREKFEKKIINEQGTGLSLPNPITMADLVANNSCKFTTGLQPTDTGTYWLAIADVDRPDRKPPVKRGDYYDRLCHIPQGLRAPLVPPESIRGGAVEERPGDALGTPRDAGPD